MISIALISVSLTVEEDAAALRLKLLDSIRTSKSAPKPNVLVEKDSQQEADLSPEIENKGESYLFFIILSKLKAIK